MLPVAIARWEHIATTGNFETLEQLLTEDIVFESPIVHTPQVGRDVARKYLVGAVRVLGGPESRFVRRWFAEQSAVLELEAQVDGIKINAVDIVTWNAEDRIQRFKVMVRPLKAMNVLQQAMGQILISNG